MIIKKVTHGAWIQIFEVDGGKVKMIEEDFEAGDIVDYEDVDNHKIDLPEELRGKL